MRHLIFVILTMLSWSSYGNQDPKCQAKTLWHAVAEKRDIPELWYCNEIQLPDGKWIPRVVPNKPSNVNPIRSTVPDVNSTKDYVETPEDIRIRQSYGDTPPDLLERLFKQEGYVRVNGRWVLKESITVK